jgi:hypothetical protein
VLGVVLLVMMLRGQTIGGDADLVGSGRHAEVDVAASFTT